LNKLSKVTNSQRSTLPTRQEKDMAPDIVLRDGRLSMSMGFDLPAVDALVSITTLNDGMGADTVKYMCMHVGQLCAPAAGLLGARCINT
jgi:hypothetical protein